jgi:Holliday junction resolvase RusA-like endonuclease
MTTVFTLPGRLIGMNEIINSARHSRWAGARQKRVTEESIMWQIMIQKVPRFKVPVYIKIRWFEPDRRRDRDNIQSATKFIMDALQTKEIIVNDSQKWIKQLHNTEVNVDKLHPRVEVWISDEWIR